jgi:Tfp pilus assembly protein PilF
MPRLADIHTALAGAYVQMSDDASAVREARAAIELNPADTSAKRALAFGLVKLHQHEEAWILLAELVRLGSQESDVYLELGRLQLEKGEIKAAVASLEAGAKVDPTSEAIHHELADAYRRDSRTVDAERETKLYEAIRNDNSNLNVRTKPN